MNHSPYQAVLFDLDGTLLPIAKHEEFVKVYFSGLAKKMAPHGYESGKLIESIWAGMKAMIQNNGKVTNDKRFRDCFCNIYGEEAERDFAIFEEFYHKEFSLVQAACGYNPMAKQVVSLCRQSGMRVILATNPVFPAIATHTRVRWAGLEPEDFERITTYENASYCKPNPLYYQEIINLCGLNPNACLMVGNDVGEDMIASQLGMQVFLLTDCLINKSGEDISHYPNGGFAELLDFLQLR